MRVDEKQELVVMVSGECKGRKRRKGGDCNELQRSSMRILIVKVSS